MTTQTNSHLPAKQSILQSANLHNAAEFEELKRHRILCGWAFTDEIIAKWRDMADAEDVAIYWIIPSAPSSAQYPDLNHSVGHIMGSRRFEASFPEQQLDIYASAPASVTAPTGSSFSTEGGSAVPTAVPVFHIWNLFVLPAHRLAGHGRAAVCALEAMAAHPIAQSAPATAQSRTEYITLNALNRKYIEDEKERKDYARVCTGIGIEMPARGSSNEDWYARMGYRVWRHEAMIPVVLDGVNVLLDAVWMRKVIYEGNKEEMKEIKMK